MLNKTQIRRNLKSMGKRMLKGSWGLALLVMLVLLLVELSFTLLLYATATLLGLDPTAVTFFRYSSASAAQILTYTRLSGLTSLIQSLLTIPISFGVIAWFIALGDGAREPLSTVFCWLDSLRRFGKSLLMALLLGLRVFGWTLLFFLFPVGLLGYLFVRLLELASALSSTFPAPYFDFFENGLYYVNPDYLLSFFKASPELVWLAAAAVLLLFVCVFFFCAFLMRYLPVRYLLNRYPEKSCSELLKRSVQMMKGHLFEALWYQCSFLGWMLLAAVGVELLSFPVRMQSGILLSICTVLILPLPLVAVSIYRTMSNVLFCEYVEDAARLKEGAAPYSVCPDETSFSPDFTDPGTPPRETAPPFDFPER